MHLFKPHFYTAFMLLFASHAAMSQNLSASFTGSEGGYFSNSNGSLQYALGDIAVASFSGSSNNLTQGFEQNDFIINSIAPRNFISDIHIYPNPASSIISIECSQNIQSISFEDLIGRGFIVPTQIDNLKSLCDLSSLAAGTYIINIKLKDIDQIIHYKILKTSLH